MTDVSRLAARPAAYLRETGVPHLFGGLTFFFLGLSALLPAVLPHSFVAQEAPKWAAIALCCGGAWISRRLQQRYVFPRGGYVEVRTNRLPGAIAAAVVVVLLWRFHQLITERLLWPAFALVFAAISLAEGIRRKHAAAVCFGIYMVGIAGFLWWVPGNNYERSGWGEMGVGLPLALYGAFRLRAFLNANPLPRDNAHE
jgi:hypothetical protein